MSMNINENNLEYLARYAKIEVSEEEKKVLIYELEKVIEYFDKLKELKTEDTSNEPIIDYDYKEINKFREDFVKESFKREEILKNAPCIKDGYIAVPKIV